MDKVVSSPLTYWGGKRWLFKTLLPLIPEGTTEIFSPFLGGGGIEINLAHRGYTVHAYDNYAPLVNFWQHWLDDPEAVRLAVYELLSLYSRAELRLLFRRRQDELTDGLASAAYFSLFRRLGYSGLARSSKDTFLHKYYLRHDGEYVQRLDLSPNGQKIFPYWEFWQSKPCQTLNVNQSDFERVFWIHNHHFAYIDPPYIENEWQYRGSENGFNHGKLRELLGERGKWVLSYNDHPKAYELYDGFHIQPIRRGSDGRQELLILSHDIAEQVQPKQLDLF